jgi:hypothetical protein
MTIPHLDLCLNPERYQPTYTTLSYTNLNGEYALNVIDVFEENFRNTISAEVQTNPLSNVISKYGESFYNDVNVLNTDFLKRSYIVEQIPEYEVLSERLKNGRTITPFEYAGFILEYSYTPSSAVESYNLNGPRFLGELNDFYNGSFSSSIMGGFCSLFGSVFGAIGGFFSLIGEVGGLIQDALSFINKIKNIEDPIKALFEKIKVTALINAIKEKIAQAVEKMINKVKQAIENFNPQNILNQVQSFIQNNIGKRISQLKEDIGKFFTEENIQRIKDKIKGLIDYAVGLFENPSLEEIQFLIARFCGFAAGIEGLINGLKAPLDDFSNRYLEVFNTLQNASNRILGESIRAGAIRFDSERREQVINTEIEEWTARGNPAPIDGNERNGLPEWEDLYNNRHPDLMIQGRWISVLGREGWTRMDQDFRVRIMRLHRAAREAGIYSGKLILNSGWRSQEYNASLDGASRTSMHLAGLAADLTWNGFRPRSEEVEIFARIARSVGIPGRGFYNGFIHVAISQENFDQRS